VSHNIDNTSDNSQRRSARATTNDDEAREKFGGFNIGAAFFGWLVAIAMAIILTSLVGAIAAGIGSTTGVTQTQAQREAGTVGLTAGIILVVVLLLAYYTGGYVAGRMSRFDGGRQGLAVWLIGLLVTILAVVLGVVFGAQYNILDRVSLPRIPIPTDQMTLAGIITAVVILVGTLLAAMFGGKVGHRYHDKVDRAAHR
jgi:cytochrome b subunit of formate dehydrogenase